MKASLAALKGRYGVNAYVKLRLGDKTNKHAEWAALTFEQIQDQPEIKLANWKYFSRNWTTEKKQKWADIKSVDEYKRKTSPDAKKEHGKLSFLLKYTDMTTAQATLAKYPGIEFEELLKKEEVQIITFKKFKSTWSEKTLNELGDPTTYEEYLLAKKVRYQKNLDRWFQAVFKDRASSIRKLYPDCTTPTEVWATKREEGKWRVPKHWETGPTFVPRLTLNKFVPLGLYPANYNRK